MPRPALSRVEELESRTVPSAAFDLTGLTALRADPAFADVDGALPGQPRNVGIAVLDSGAFANHPDLRGNFRAYYDAVSNTGINGQVFTDASQIGPAGDPDGHGSHTAGTAASTNPAIGVATRADLIVVRALGGPNDRNVQHDTVLTALNWVVANQQRFNIRVINMSLGSGGNYNSPISDSNGYGRVFRQLEGLGVTIVAASGNSYGQFAGQTGAAYPAAAATVSVGSVWEDNGAGDQFPVVGGGYQNGRLDDFFASDLNGEAGRFAASSQRSTLPNQVAAPGETILSTWNGAPGQNGQPKLYDTIGGTSMASPFVAGVVALMQDAAFSTSGRYLTPAQVLSTLRSTADVFTDSSSGGNQRLNGTTRQASDLPETGAQFARVNAFRAVQASRPAVGGNPGGGTNGADANSTRTTAYVVPDLTGTRVFSIRGRLGADGTTATGANDVDLVKVEVPYRGALLAATSLPSGGAGFDSYLRIFDAAGNEIAFNDDFNGSQYAAVGLEVNAGTYYIGVSSFNNGSYSITAETGRTNGGSEGDYDLAVQLANPNGNAVNPYFDPNGTLDGAVEYPTAPAITPFFDEAFTLFDDPGRPEISGRVGYLLAGTIGSDPPPLDDDTGTRPDVGPGDVDVFRYEVPDDGRLFIRITSEDSLALQFPLGVPPSGIGPFDTYLRVFDQDGNELSFDDDSGNGRDSLLILTGLQRGQVLYFAVSAFGNGFYDPNDPNERSASGAGGYYELWSTFDNGDLNGTAYTAVPLPSVGSGAGGTIGTDFGGPTLGQDGTLDVDFVQLDVPSDGVLKVTATGANGFRPSVTVWGFQVDASGNVTGFDRIATSDRAQSVVLAPVVGGRTYFLSFTGQGNGGFNWFATASGTGGQTGAYTVQTELLPPGAGDAIQDKGIGGAPPRNLNLGVAVDGTIGEDSSATGDTFVTAAAGGNGLRYGQGDLDTYKFVSPITGRVRFRASGTTFLGGATDPVMRVFDAAGNDLAYNDDASDSERDAVITLDVIAGQTYYIGITGYSAGAADYQILNGVFNSSVADTTLGGYALLATDVSPPVVPVVLSPTGLPNGRAGTAYTATLTATGPAGPFTFAVTAGTLPAGLTLTSAGVFSGTPTTAGAFSFTVTATTAGGAAGSQGYGVTVDPPPPPPPPPAGAVRPIAAGGATDGSVRLLSAAGSVTVSPFGNTGTPTRTAVADVNGDGVPDLIAVTGPGTPIRVAVISGVDNATVLVAPFDPFGGDFTGGGYVAAADLDGDGRAEFVVTPDEGGGPRVSVFSLNAGGSVATRANFLGIDDSNFRGGARAALGDVNRDGVPDVVVSAGFGGGPRTAIFNGTTVFGVPSRLVNDFFAFPGDDATNLRNGSFVATGDVDGDTYADLIFGGGPGGAPRVFILSGALVSAGNVGGAQTSPIANFFVAGDANDRGGARVAASNRDGDGRADVAVGSGENRPSRVRVYLGSGVGGGGEPAAFQDLDPFAATLPGGVFVG